MDPITVFAMLIPVLVPLLSAVFEAMSREDALAKAAAAIECINKAKLLDPKTCYELALLDP